MLERYSRVEQLLGVAVLVAVAVNVAAGVAADRAEVAVAASVALCLLAAIGLETRRATRLEHAATRAHVSEAVRETTAAMQLVSLIPADAPLPAMGDWAIQPSGLLAMYHLVGKHRPALVVELGSGSSTIVLGHAVRAYGGRLVSIDHEQRFADATTEALAAHGLTQTCTVVVAPLVDVTVEGGSRRWYDREVFKGLDDIGLLLIDGPPEDTTHWARYPAMPCLRNQLAEGAFVVLDDANRVSESGILQEWSRKYPELEPVGSIAPRIGIRRVRAQGHGVSA